MSKPTEVNGGFTHEAFESLTAEANQLREEAARLRAELLELRGALDAAREEVKDKEAITAERDAYRKSLQALTWKDFTFTDEEIVDLVENGVTLDQKFFEDLEREMRSLESQQ